MKKRVSQNETIATFASNVSTADLDKIKQQAYLVLEDNRRLQEQIDYHKNLLAEIQKNLDQKGSFMFFGTTNLFSEIQRWNLKNSFRSRREKTGIRFFEVSESTRRELLVQNEKLENIRTIETMKIRYEELQTKFDGLMIEKDRRIGIEEHLREIHEMKRSLG